VLVKEMRVHELGVSPGSCHLVVELLFVKEFVACYGVYSRKKSEQECENIIL
jgi:hypothetical protein